MKTNARKRLWFLFRKNGQLVRVFINKPKIKDHEFFPRVWTESQVVMMQPPFNEGDKLQLWVLVGRKYEFAKEYK